MKNQIGSNQYVKTIKYRKVIIALFIVIAGIGLYQWYMAPKSSKIAPQSVVSTKDDGLTAEQKQVLEKQAELAKQEQILLNKKVALESQIKDIENQLGEVRSQKLSFK